MEIFKKSIWAGSFLSGILAFFTIGYTNFFTNWLFLIPLFIAFSGSSPGMGFKKGIIYGLILGCFLFFWMIPGSERFTGKSMAFGFLAFLLSLIFFSLYHGLIFYVFCTLRDNNLTRRSIYYNAILIASCIVTAESLLMFVSRSYPWFGYHSGAGLADNLYSIQPASLFGVHILSFIAIVFNYLAAEFLADRKYKNMLVPASLFFGYMVFGLILLKYFESKVVKQVPFNLAILSENILPDIKWDDTNGNLMVNKLLQLNRQATASKPGLILWSESAIPWTYREDDDLVNEILKTSNPSNISHVLGINTEITSNQVYNSAYSILPGGQVAGRYDKQYLLGLIEQPLNGFIIPFFSSKGFVAKNDTGHAQPLPTSFGKAGIFICNEAVVPEAAASKCREGATFLCNMSNDGWFNNTYLVNAHFYFDRLRAVESRKDLAINCNNGYSGLIKASGAIEEMQRSEDPFVQLVSVETNSNLTLASAHPRLFAFICMLFMVFAFAYKKVGSLRSKRM